MTIGAYPEQIAVDAFIDYLRANLPAKVTAVNLTLAAVLKSALAGPFTIPSGAVLRLSASAQEATPTSVPLTAGSRTAAQLVTDIGVLVSGITPTADDAGRLVLTAAAPVAGTPSIVIVAQDTDGATTPAATGSNAALGWAEGGEHSEVRALVAPSWRGVCDGWPLTAPDMGQGFWVILGNRTCKPTHPGPRRDTFAFSCAAEVWRPFSTSAPPHRTRAGITACVRAVRELVTTVDGRYLGRQATGDVQLADVSDVAIQGVPLNTGVPGVMFDVARLNLTCRVFQRPE